MLYKMVSMQSKHMHKTGFSGFVKIRHMPINEAQARLMIDPISLRRTWVYASSFRLLPVVTDRATPTVMHVDTGWMLLQMLPIAWKV